MNCRPNQRRNLFALGELGFDGVREGLALQRHHALIALAAFHNVESERKVSLAEQVGEVADQDRRADVADEVDQEDAQGVPGGAYWTL